MSFTQTTTQTDTCTVTQARYLASKVKADLLRMNRYYERPSESRIDEFELELQLLLQYDFLREIEYGFARGRIFDIALKYSAGGVLGRDDDPGGIQYRHLPVGSRFVSYLRYNARWQTAFHEKKEFLRLTPIHRKTGSGYAGSWSEQRCYSAGELGLARSGI